MITEQKVQRAVKDFKLPSDTAVSENELIWIEFLRIICIDQVPPPDSRMVVGLRKIMGVV